jgi:hypothetical protein
VAHIPVEQWVGSVDSDSRRKLDGGPPPAPTDLVISLQHDAAAGQLAYLKASIAPNKWDPKLAPVSVGADTTTFTIPANEVVTQKEFKLTFRYRLAKIVPQGTEIDFTLAAGVLVSNVVVTVAK